MIRLTPSSAGTRV